MSAERNCGASCARGSVTSRMSRISFRKSFCGCYAFLVKRQFTIRTPEAYIFTVAHHVALQHAMQSGLSNAAVELDELLTDSLPLNHPDPALEVSAAQFLEQLDAALCQLSPKIQAAFLMYRRDGASLDEISERLHITRPMTKKYLAKAMMHLRNG